MAIMGTLSLQWGCPIVQRVLWSSQMVSADKPLRRGKLHFFLSLIVCVYIFENSYKFMETELYALSVCKRCDRQRACDQTPRDCARDVFL